MSAQVPGLSAVDSARYAAALAENCDVRIKVYTLTMSHQLVASITPVAIDGQINITQADGANVTRTLQMGFYDPDHALRLDSDNPTAGVGGMDRLIRIRTYVRSDATQGQWLGAPAFTGRPVKIGRDGDVVTVEAHGKESLHMRGVGRTHRPKGEFYVDAIRAILQASGETRFKFPPTTEIRNKLPTVSYYGGPDEAWQPWTRAWRLAQSIGLQLYYDPDGVANLRWAPVFGSAPAWELIEQGPGANTLSRVKNETDLTTVRNQVVVFGHTTPIKNKKGEPAGASKLLTAVRSANPAHQYSGQKLGMNGHTWFNRVEFDREDLHTQAEVNAYADARLAELLIGATDVETTTLPVWHLEPLDIIRLKAKDNVLHFRLKNASIPLGPSETGMTVGYRFSVRKPSAGRLR